MMHGVPLAMQSDERLRLAYTRRWIGRGYREPLIGELLRRAEREAESAGVHISAALDYVSRQAEREAFQNRGRSVPADSRDRTQ